MASSRDFIRPTLIASSMFLASSLPGPAQSDEVSVQYLRYSEQDNRVRADAVSIDGKKEIGTDDVIKLNFTYDTLTGGTPTWMDTSSGGTQKAVGVVKLGGQATPISENYQTSPFSDKRYAGDVLWTHRFQNRNEIDAGFNVSKESDYLSYGGSADYRYLLNDANTTISFGGSYMRNEITPSVVANTVDNFPAQTTIFMDTPTNSFETMDFYNLQLGLTQVLTKTSLFNIGIFTIIEDGYLNNPYQRVIREYNINGSGGTDQYIFEDSRPNNRVAFGFSLKYIKEFLGKYALHSGYRFYHDDWEINSNTLDFTLYADITNKLTLAPGFRFYHQDKAHFYGNIFPEKYSTTYSTTSQKYASSDFRLANYETYTVDLGITYKFTKDFSYNVLGSYFDQSTGLTAVIVTTGIKYNF